MDINRYMSIPYIFHGHDWSGCDCYGLLMLYYREELGIKLTDFRYEEIRDCHEMKGTEIIDNNVDVDWIRISIEEAQKHDILLIAERNLPPHHCGVFISPIKFLHTSLHHGPAVSRVSTWRKRIFAAYRHKSLLSVK